MWEFFIETAAISININTVQNQIKNMDAMKAMKYEL